jgi:hypothetical protein
MRWTLHMISNRQQASRVWQIDSYNQSQYLSSNSHIQSCIRILFWIHGAGCHWNFLTPDSLVMLLDWSCWNLVRSSCVECGWPSKPSGWNLRLFWVSVSIWTLSSTLYVNYVVVFLTPEVELNLSCCKHSLHTNTFILIVPKHSYIIVGWKSVVLPAWI